MSISRTRRGPCRITAGRSRRFIVNSQWPEWLVQDQRFVHLRPDVLSYETEPLTQDLDVAGPVLARLFASTSGTDSDWIVKLIDVYPEDAPQPLAGYQLMIANDVFRGRFRKSFEHPEPIVAGQVEEYAIDLHWTDHRFAKGPQDHGADPEHLVPADRSQPAEVRPQYLRGEGVGLSSREPAGLSWSGAGDASRAAGHACGENSLTRRWLTSRSRC